MSRQDGAIELNNEVLTVSEAAAYLRISRVTAWRWCQKGTIPAVRVGGRWRIRRDDLLSLLEPSRPETLAPKDIPADTRD